MIKFLRLVEFLVVFSILSALCSVIEMEEASIEWSSYFDIIGQQPVVLIEDNIQENILKLQKLYPGHSWSELFRCLCKDLHKQSNVILHGQMKAIITECIEFCQKALHNNFSYAEELRCIKFDLQDYQEFLLSENSALDIHNILFTKRKRCCSPCASCFTRTNTSVLTNCATCVVVNGNDITSFLPTGPNTSVTSNFFYATKQGDAGAVLPTNFVAIPFNSVGFNDGNWAVSGGGTTFTAKTPGTYLVTLNMPYTLNGNAAGGTNNLYVSPYLNGSPIPTATQVFTDFLGIGESRSVNVSSNFVVSVNQGEALTIQNRQDAFVANEASFTFQNSSSTPQWNNGSITLIRIK